jgi:acyl-CoA synthetase (AMP-forming)/AMP-acid ligase II
VVFLDEIPRLGSGKPDRRALAEWAEPAEVEVTA